MVRMHMMESLYNTLTANVPPQHFCKSFGHFSVDCRRNVARLSMTALDTILGHCQLTPPLPPILVLARR